MFRLITAPVAADVFWTHLAFTCLGAAGAAIPLSAPEPDEAEIRRERLRWLFGPRS